MNVIHMGIDIGYRRDTAAVYGSYRDVDDGVICGAFYKCWKPPVTIPQVTDYVLERFETCSVGGVWFDPHQWAAEAQRLESAGFGRFLQEVNQTGSFMIQIATNLDTLMQRDAFLPFYDAEVLSHLSWTAVKLSEAGPRIIKQAQTRPIDITVAMAMSVWGSSQDDGFFNQPVFKEEENVVQLEMLI